MTDETWELASRWKRLEGALLDSFISVVILVLTLIITGVFQEQHLTNSQLIFFSVVGCVPLFLVNGYFLAKQGQTVGKMLMDTRIVSYADNKILSLSHIFILRYLPLFIIMQVPIIGNIFIIADCLFIFRKDKRCLHDLIAGTKVINA